MNYDLPDFPTLYLRRHTSILLWALNEIGGSFETAKLMGITDQAVRRWQTNGRLPMREWHSPIYSAGICAALAEKGHAVSIDMLLGAVEPDFELPAPPVKLTVSILSKLDGRSPTSAEQLSRLLPNPPKQIWPVLNRLTKQGVLTRIKENGVSYFQMNAPVPPA